MALSVTASCDIKQAERERCKMPMTCIDMQLSIEFGEYCSVKAMSPYANVPGIVVWV